MYLHTCIVDYDIQAVEVFNCLLNQTHSLLVLRNIGLNDKGLTFVLFDDLAYLLGLIFRVSIVYHYCCPFFGKLNSDTTANTTIGTGYNSNFLI